MIFISIIIPVALIVLILSIYSGLAFLVTRKVEYWHLFLKVVGSTFMLIGVLLLVRWLNSDVKLSHGDFHGDYVIDRDYFPGPNAQWQYEHYKFTIRQDDSLFFYVMAGDSVKSVFKGKMNVSTAYASARITFDMHQPVHHVFTEQPLIVRSCWGFNIVLYSPFYNHMYFEKD